MTGSEKRNLIKERALPPSLFAIIRRSSKAGQPGRAKAFLLQEKNERKHPPGFPGQKALANAGSA